MGVINVARIYVRAKDLKYIIIMLITPALLIILRLFPGYKLFYIGQNGEAQVYTSIQYHIVPIQEVHDTTINLRHKLYNDYNFCFIELNFLFCY